MSGIYKITNPKGKVYIGQSINPILRLSHYKRFDCKEQPKIYNSLKKYGIENHTFEVIHFCNVQELNYFERYYQELYNVIKNGLNCRLTITTDKSGFFSDETKLKMSIARKGTRLGLQNNNSQIILDKNTGVFYYSVNDLCKYLNYSKSYLSEMLRGKKNNKTQYIYI